MWPPVLLTAVATAALIAGLGLEKRSWVVVAKPLASAGFVWLGLVRMDPASTVDRWLLVALVLGFLGDQLLLGDRTFEAGLGAFLAGHLAYLPGFAAAAPVGEWRWWPLVPLAALAVAALLWMWPHLERMRVPVVAYLLVICAMTWGAWGATLAQALPWRCGVGATLFLLSDLTVARQRFVRQGFVNGAVGLPLYYAGQLLLASCVGLA